MPAACRWGRSHSWQQLLDPLADVPAVEIGRDAEAGAVEAQAADELDRCRAGDRQADVVDHLSLVVLVDPDDAGAGRGARDRLGGEGEQRDRTDVADARALRAQ